MRPMSEARTSAGRRQEAIVLSGAAANAAYEVGVLKVLLDKGVDPYCYSGTSVGALNAAVMASHTDPGDAVEKLERLWRDHIPGVGTTNGLFRVRMDPTQYWSPSTYSRPLRLLQETVGDVGFIGVELLKRAGYATAFARTPQDAAIALTDFSQLLDLAPLRKLVREAIDPGKIELAPRKLRVSAVNWDTGVPRTFTEKELKAPGGYDVIAAAMAIPGVVPPQVVDGSPYVDAAVLMTTPLRPAISAADKTDGAGLTLHLIYLDTSRAEVPIADVANTFSIVYRLFLLTQSRSANADVTRAASINEQLRTRRLFETVAIEDGGDGDLFLAISKKVSPEAARFWKKLTRDSEGRVPVTIHRYSPTRHIHGFTMFQYRKDLILDLIRAGQEDAVAHDCEQAGCIIA
jgi:predicted acylesterase/phospholipase RssA